MEYKRLQFKALDTDTEQGVFDGHASVWDIVDSEGDVMERGAFAKTITEGIAKDGVPILALHNDTVLLDQGHQVRGPEPGRPGTGGKHCPQAI